MTRSRVAHVRRLLALLGLPTAGVLLASHGRADAPPGRYTVDADTVVDTKTNLTWQRTIVPDACEAGGCDWQAAWTYCASLGLAGGGWRLPSVKELVTIVDYSNESGATIDPAFPNTPEDWFWSSTPLAGSPGSAWYVNFGGGGVDGGGVDGPKRVRCVR